MGRIFHFYCKALEALIALGLALMVLLVFGNVVLRYAFNSGIVMSEELSRWLFVWVTFLGAVIALHEHTHLGTDMLVKRLPLIGRRLCMAVAYGLMIFACWLVLRGALDQTKINWDVSAPSSGASMAIFYASGVVFAVSALLILLADLYRVLTDPHHDPLAGPKPEAQP
jgi:TRAP-type C4-dicarboxylate transport system permease small subunit